MSIAGCGSDQYPGIKELVHGHVLSVCQERPSWVEALCEASPTTPGC